MLKHRGDVWAFPTQGGSVSLGMSLRDYFAAKAMQANLMNAELRQQAQDDPLMIARNAYGWADAMLAERDK